MTFASRFPITDEDKPDGCVMISDVLERAKLQELENPQMETFVKRSWRTTMGLQEWNELPASIRVRDIYSVEGNGGLSSGGRTIVKDERNRSHSVSSKTKRATRGPRHGKGRGQWRVKAVRVWGIAWRTWLLLQLLFASAALLPLFVSPRPCSWPWLSLTSNIVLSFPQGPPPI